MQQCGIIMRVKSNMQKEDSRRCPSMSTLMAQEGAHKFRSILLIRLLQVSNAAFR